MEIYGSETYAQHLASSKQTCSSKRTNVGCDCRPKESTRMRLEQKLLKLDKAEKGHVIEAENLT